MQEREQNARQNAIATVTACKNEYAEKKRILASHQREADTRESEAADLINNYEAKIKEEASLQTSSFKKKMQKEYDKRASNAEATYESKTKAIYNLTLGALIYGFFATVLTACMSERFSNDFIAFLTTIANAITGIFNLASNGAIATWMLNEKIPYQYLDVIIAGLLSIIVFILIAGVMYGAIFFGIFSFYKFYKKEFADITSLIVALASLALLVWFADELTFIDWNVVLIWISIHGIYLLIRMLTTQSKNDSYY